MGRICRGGARGAARETFTFADPGPGEVCPFDVLITATADSLVRTTLPNGALVITGPGIATVTNEDTGASRVYNISGPGRFDPETGRLVLFGQSLILQATDVGPPFLIITSGQVSFIVNQPIDRPLRGRISHDICAELATS